MFLVLGSWYQLRTKNQELSNLSPLSLPTSSIMLRERLKWLLFPGLNLNARLRFRELPKHFGRPKPGENA